jgi:hypothetical protein
MSGVIKAGPVESISTFDILTAELGMPYTWLIYKFGYRTLADLKRATTQDLAAIPGVGSCRLDKILRVISAYDDDGRLIVGDELSSSKVVYVDFRQLDLFR